MIVKTCKKHGALSEDKCYKDTNGEYWRCTECRKVYFSKYFRKKAAHTSEEKFEVQADETVKPKFEIFMQVSDKLVKNTAKHYQLHRRYS